MDLFRRSPLALFLSIATAIIAGSFAGASVAHADAIGKIKLPPGFKAELVHEVPAETEGSWVALTPDDKGRLIASDQHGSLYRITPSPIGGDPYYRPYFSDCSAADDGAYVAGIRRRHATLHAGCSDCE